jgi:outer membrane receptor protein involved in Fe transport
VSASYENAQFIIISQPWVYDEDGLGYNHDLFHIYPNTGALYIQDKVNYEGLIGDIGLRYDYWFPGEQVERAIEDESRTIIAKTTREGFRRDTHELFGRRFKGHLSPRIAVSFPITDRDNLFFNYGHFSQLPNYVYVYSKLSSVSSEQFPIIGNPNLNPEISVQYEIGARHQFTQTVAANVTLTYKDIYDYPTSIRFTPLSGGDLFLYINRDYARSRGIEVEIKKKRIGLVGGSITYTYSIATGKSSDPNALKLVQESGIDVKTGETSLAEEYLWWNRPHKLSLTLSLGAGKNIRPKLLGLTLPSDWNLNIQWEIQSGKAYTPMQDERETGKDYSENGPADDTVDLRFTKYFKTGATNAKIYLDVNNLFNNRRVRRVDRETGEAYEAGKGTYRFRQGDSEWTRLTTIYTTQDPSIYGSPRQARLGLGIEW